MRVVIETTPQEGLRDRHRLAGLVTRRQDAPGRRPRPTRLASRYAVVAKRAGVAFRPPRTVAGIEIVERLTGDANTDFGIPAARVASDDEPIPSTELTRLSAC